MHASQNKRNRPVPQAVTIARFRKQRCPTPQRQHRDEPDLGSPNLRVNTARNQNSEPLDTPNRHKIIPPSSRQARMPKCPKNQPTATRHSGAVDGANICKLARGVNTEFREFRRTAWRDVHSAARSPVTLFGCSDGGCKGSAMRLC